MITARRRAPELNFAPVSGAQSGLLRFASAWFVFHGAANGLLVVIAAIRFGFRDPRPAPALVFFLGLLILATTAGGLVWTGSLLARDRRVGGYAALGFVLLPIVYAAFAWEPLDMFQIAFAVLGVIVLALIWHELK